jgi:hypothetical protein
MKRFFVLFSLLGCKKDDKVYYDLYNCSDDYTFVGVGADEVVSGADCEDLDLGRVDLRSSSCELEEEDGTNRSLTIGSAVIDPCMGPLGTEHSIIVYVNSVYVDDVDRATVRIESPSRGADEYKLKPDSADRGIYKTSLVSVGVDDEHREDFVRFKLWAVDPDGGDKE